MGLTRLEFKLRETSIWCAVLSIRNKSAVEVHLTVDQIVVRSDRRCTYSHGLLYKREVVLMIPVSEQYWADIDVVWNVLWPMDDQGS